MKTIEEKIWDYLDNSATQQERFALEALLDSDPAAKALFNELSEVHLLLGYTELDTPSMSFNRKVMEKVAHEAKPVSLKTRVDQRIMYLIGSFFILSILIIVGMAVLNASNRGTGFELPQLNVSFDIGKYITPTSRNIFLLADAVIALLYLDGVLRGKLRSGRGNSAGS